MSKNLAAFLLITCVMCGPAFAVHENSRDRQIRVVTYNMYLGTDFTEIFSAQSPTEVVTEVAEAYGDVVIGNPQERIDEIADQIIAADATLVGLQEVALWRTGTFSDPAPAVNISYDFLAMLLDELSSRGAHSEAIAVQTNFDAELPGAGPAIIADVRYTDRDVIMVRSDLRTSEVKIEGSQAQTFDTLLTLPLLIGNITIPRGWTSVDIKFRGKTYRFVNAHTEAFHPLVQYAQTAELLQGPANTKFPVIMGGDFNSDAEASGASYLLLTGSGFADTWEIANPLIPGYTWPLFVASPSIFTPPSERLDLILTRGDIGTALADVIGEDPALDTTTSGLRASDHAGVSATLVLQP